MAAPQQQQQQATHLDLTHAEPRERALHRVRVTQIAQPAFLDVRVVRLALLTAATAESEPAFRFLPGQWVDVHIPAVDRVGGFTLTSTPRDACGQRRSDDQNDDDSGPPGGEAEGAGWVELAIQRSASKNPPADWFWRPREQVLEKEVELRVGGSFHWPPRGLDPRAVTSLVLVAGGVGINPIISILTHLHQNPSLLPPRIHLLYAHRIPAALLESLKPSSPPSSPPPQTHIKASRESFLFLPRLDELFASPPFSTSPARYKAAIYLTPTQPLAQGITSGRLRSDRQQEQREEREERTSPSSFWEEGDGPVATHFGRIRKRDLLAALGDDILARKGVVAYVCGPQGMTDAFVEELQGIEGVERSHILCEKWW